MIKLEDKLFNNQLDANQSETIKEILEKDDKPNPKRFIELIEENISIVLNQFNRRNMKNIYTFRLLSQFWNSLKVFIKPILGWKISNYKTNKKKLTKSILKSWFLSISRFILFPLLSENKSIFDNFYTFLPKLQFKNENENIIPISIQSRRQMDNFFSGFGLFIKKYSKDSPLFDKHEKKAETNLSSIKSIFSDTFNSEEEIEKIFLFLSALNPKEIDKELIEEHKKGKSKYVLTFDNVSKMLFLQFRNFVNLPTIISGETGCGKTALIEYLFETILGQKIKTLNVNNSIKKKDIQNLIEEGEKCFPKPFIILFDELNTAPKSFIPIFKYLFIDKMFNEKKISTNIRLIAAINPYRERSGTDKKEYERFGLFYQKDDENEESKKIQKSVYRVQKLPDSLQKQILNFNSLQKEQELPYIQKMVKNTFDSIFKKEEDIKRIRGFMENFIEYIQKSHQYIREEEENQNQNQNEKKNLASKVSLRDISRTLRIFRWIYESRSRAGIILLKDKIDLKQINLKQIKEQKEKEEDGIIIQKAIYLSLFVCYEVREKNQKKRKKYSIKIFGNEKSKDYKEIIENAKTNLIENLDYNFKEKMIAKNKALKENCLLLYISIYTQIPLFIIGKPGTSKSISLEVILKSFKPPFEINELLRKLKLRSLYQSFIQCSQIRTNKEIEEVFKLAKQNTKNGNTLGVVVLDEIALAEWSSEFPLKTLHSKLEESEKELSRRLQKRFKQNKNENENEKLEDILKEMEAVSVVSISNWILDPSEMNRGILIYRDSITEIEKTAQQILSSKNTGMNSKIPELFADSLSRIYKNIIKNQKEKEKNSEWKPYFGLRDFYYFVKMIGYSYITHNISYNNESLISNALLRNFNSKPEIIQNISQFQNESKSLNLISLTKITTKELIYQNIQKRIFENYGLNNPNEISDFSRNMMILIDETLNLPIILQIIESLIEEEGRKISVVFGNSFPKDQTKVKIIKDLHKKETIFMHKISMGHIENLIKIDPNFRLISICDKSHAYHNETPAILNRFEKYLLKLDEFIEFGIIRRFYEQQKEMIKNL
ncbi:hypothetical protein M0811_11553 [Anaeramoeba ignava]|uniref:AAA+ ATPase domain-containing protein n=1 Tax=Anaeramoeba ignava TaxID=1746090 RepID=A0A9Q0LAM8_ANAIG|nr:hypothetical protein M0811_11553 [Anaeramoeba ignava]